MGEPTSDAALTALAIHPSLEPIYVFHSCLSVPATSVLNLYIWLCLQLNHPVFKWVSLLIQEDSSSVLQSFAFRNLLPNSYVHLLPREQFEQQLNEKIDSYAQESNIAGTIVLLSTNGNYSALRKAKIMGWKIVLAYPAKVSCKSLQIANKCLEIPEEFTEETPKAFLDVHRDFCGPPSPKSVVKRKAEEETFEEFLCKTLPTSEQNLEIIFREAEETISNFSSQQWQSIWPADVMEVNTKMEEEKLIEARKEPSLTDVLIKAAAIFKPKKAVENPKKLKKVIKFAPQCPLVGKKEHVAARCNYWHPKKTCEFYPKCFSNADNCGYGHPFCSDGPCTCNIRDPQMNHRVFNERYKALTSISLNSST